MTENSILFITGANTGLGLETVKSLYQSTETYTILLGGRDLGKAKAAAEEVQKESSGSSSVIYPVQIDISSDESISKAFDHIKEQYGRVDTLINNAGMINIRPTRKEEKLILMKELCLISSFRLAKFP